MSIIIDLYQQGRIVAAENRAGDAAHAAQRVTRDVDRLKARDEAITLASQALWEIVREKLGMDDADLLAKIQEVDLRDGKADGKITRQGITCPDCSRVNNSTRKHCLYCGFKQPVSQVFEKS